MVEQFYCNFEQIRCKSGLQTTATQFQIDSRSISPRIYSQILVPLRHHHTNAKPKFITTVDRCFNARHHSSNPMSARKTLTTAPSKFVQRLITARASWRSSSGSAFKMFALAKRTKVSTNLRRLGVPNFDWALLER
jgi:hypothetical protein